MLMQTGIVLWVQSQLPALDHSWATGGYAEGLPREKPIRQWRIVGLLSGHPGRPGDSTCRPGLLYRGRTARLRSPTCAGGRSLARSLRSQSPGEGSGLRNQNRSKPCSSRFGECYLNRFHGCTSREFQVAFFERHVAAATNDQVVQQINISENAALWCSSRASEVRLMGSAEEISPSWPSVTTDRLNICYKD